MSYESARKSIQEFFYNNFTILSKDKIAWDNVEFAIPNKTEWIRISIKNSNSNHVSLGINKRTRRYGFVTIQVFVPENTETLIATKIIDSIVSIFETKRLNGFVFQSPNVNEVGTFDSWFQINISVLFHYDEITTIT